ncbi:hypothetical protein Sulba_0642 [Sulfurospirillum barnesii SES-3]|uniref:Uncharacterized protein n=2 Tax=Sulfurospirillum barnesii TaxID=44674 RepID=I3XVH6_SULBS|nr:hypothetical protein Sulba_0642 [Sulfurospirillum barnesii SES-3]
MKEMLERICHKQVVFTSLESIAPKVLKSRKKLAIFSGVDRKSFYHAIFQCEQKSRFISQHADELLHLYAALTLHVNHNYKHKHLLLKAPLCSKAGALLKEKGWIIYNDIV